MCCLRSLPPFSPSGWSGGVFLLCAWHDFHAGYFFFSCSLFFLNVFLLQSHAHPHWVRQGRLFICVLRRGGRCTKRGRSRKGQEQARWCNSMFAGVCVCAGAIDLRAWSHHTRQCWGIDEPSESRHVHHCMCVKPCARKCGGESGVVYSHSRSHIRFEVAVGSRRQSIGVLYCR